MFALALVWLSLSQSSGPGDTQFDVLLSSEDTSDGLDRHDEFQLC